MKSYILVLPLMLVFWVACEENGNGSGDNQSTDSVMVELPEMLEDTTGLAATTIAPELIGKWVLAEMRLGQEPMSIEDIGESAYEFRADGTLVIYNEESTSDPTTFEYRNNSISSALLDKPLQVEELGASKLILGTEISGTSVRYIYQKQAE